MIWASADLLLKTHVEILPKMFTDYNHFFGLLNQKSIQIP